MNFELLLIKQLVEQGHFVYTPAFWSVENDIIIERLLHDKQIRRSDVKEMNQSYVYLKY